MLQFGIAKELGIPRTTVFRLAQTLEHLGLLERVDGGNSYRLALGVLSLGFEYLAALDIAQIAQPFLEKLRDFFTVEEEQPESKVESSE